MLINGHRGLLLQAIGGGGGGSGATWFDDFSSSGSLGDYALYQVGGGGTSYSITGGQLVATGGITNQSYLLYDGPEFIDGFVEATFTSADQNSILLSGRGTTNLNQGYVLSVRDASSSLLPDSWALFKVENGGTVTLINNTALGTTWPRGSNRLFRLESEEILGGTVLKVFENATLLATYTDLKSLSPGQAGVNVYGALANGFTDYQQDGTIAGTQGSQYLNRADRDSDMALGFLDTVARAGTAVNNWRGVRSKLAIPAGTKRYFEFQALNNVGFNYFVGGVGNLSEALNINAGGGPNAWTYEIGRGHYYHNGGSPVIIAPDTTNGVIGQVAYDDTTGKVWFGKDNVWVGDPALGTGETAITGAGAGTLYPIFSLYSPAAQMKVNQMAADLVYTPPSGFSGF